MHDVFMQKPFKDVSQDYCYRDCKPFIPSNSADMLDVYPAKKPKFAKNFLAGNGSIKDAIKKYVEEVKNGTFPDENYSY